MKTNQKSESFSFTRFKNVFRWYAEANMRYSLMWVVGTLLCAIFLGILMRWDNNTKFDIMYGVLFVVESAILSSRFLSILDDSKIRQQYLSIPASYAEKYFAAIALLVVKIICVGITVFIGDVLSTLLRCNGIIGNGCDLVIYSFFSDITSAAPLNFKIALIVLFFSTIIPLWAVFVTWNTFFRKYAFLEGCSFACVFAIKLLDSPRAYYNHWLNDNYVRGVIVYEISSYVYLVSGILLLVAIGFIYAGYRRYKRLQLNTSIYNLYQ